MNIAMLGWLKASIVRYRTPLISTLIGIIVLSAAISYLVDLNTVQQFYKETAIQNADKYADDAETTIKSSCIDPASLKRNPDCIKEAEYTARQNERDEYDLYSQRSMSLWNETMGKTAVLGVAIGFVSVWLIFVTFQATRQAAKAGLNSNEIAERSQRPWIVFKPLLIEPLLINDKKIQIYFDLEIENIGKRPANGIVIESFLFVPDGDGDEPLRLLDFFRNNQTPNKRGFMLFPGDDNTQRINSSGPINEFDNWKVRNKIEDINPAMLKTAQIAMGICIWYRDGDNLDWLSTCQCYHFWYDYVAGKNNLFNKEQPKLGPAGLTLEICSGGFTQ
ncbi:hypothetical protein [Parasphingorhabdus sp.]|uniref:hypothetical protein n=1 Tax=Parasphingorhabdus sp. TaxID=2709688 RepID=UPI003A8CE528